MLRDGATRLLIVAFEQTAVSVSSNRIGSFRIDRSKIPIREGIGAGILMVILLSEVSMVTEPGLSAATWRSWALFPGEGIRGRWIEFTPRRGINPAVAGIWRRGRRWHSAS